MKNVNMKNMVVLKNLPSNIIEEAIVIIKPCVNLEKYRQIEENSSIKTIKKDFIVEEAEDVVAEYMKELEKPKDLEKKYKSLLKKNKKVKSVNVLLGIIAFIGIISNIF